MTEGINITLTAIAAIRGYVDVTDVFRGPDNTSGTVLSASVDTDDICLHDVPAFQ
ncbi:MAG: hypothetical protein M1381_06905 [Deltaproteobacteria bacterium]|nr:hypothetical protein [Deltaproteobacteria bacterium]MCL5792978.1 hypothetical protein [Deltaproteobacteria bacterium]